MKKALFCFLCCLFISSYSFATIFFTVVTSSSCINGHNGSINITAGGGTVPYQYSIDGGFTYHSSPVFSGLAVGTYNVLVMDAMGSSGAQQVVVPSAGIITFNTLNILLCSNDLPYNFNGTNVFNAGTYHDTLSNSTGCDSIITLNLSILPASTSETNVSVCPQQLPFTWNGQQYNSAGIYTFTSQNSNGCDSVATLVLTLSTTDEWLGLLNNSWEEPSNWSCGVPGPSSDVVINGGTVILHFDATIHSLALNPAATLTVITGAHLTILH